MKRHWRRTFGIAALVTAVVVLLAACEPIPHPNVTVREQPDSNPRFLHLSGNGNYAVVRSSAAGATVPGAGLWRVDRRDGSVVRIPDLYGDGISADGSRLLSRYGPAVWSGGREIIAPAGAVMSEELTFGVFVDGDGAVKTWQTATLAVVNVEASFPRGNGYPFVTPLAVSDDGATVQFLMAGLLRPPIVRFIDLNAGVALDQPERGGFQDGIQTDERYLLAASGDAFVHVFQRSAFLEEPDVLLESWAELVSLPDGTVRRRYTNPGPEPIVGERIGANGNIAWVATSSPSVGDPSRAVAFGKSLVVPFEIPGAAYPDIAGTFETSKDARYLLVSPDGFIGEPVRILDWASRTTEPLPDLQSAEVSDDLRVIAGSPGWREYTADP